LRTSKGHIDVHTTGTPNKEFAFVFRIHIDESASLNGFGFQTKSAIHASFLIDGKKGFDGPVRYVGSCQYSHGGCHTNAIVGPQGRVGSIHPAVNNPRFDGIFLKIMNHVVVFLRHHVKVSL